MPSMRKRILSVVLLLVAGALMGSGSAWLIVSEYGDPFQSNTRRSVELARLLRHPMAEPMNRSGLPNLHKVSDVLYRGAQPDDEGYATLKAMGVTTVVNLRGSRSNQEQIERAGLKTVLVASDAWGMSDQNVAAFLKTVSDPSAQPVFVHCRHGADRTGTMCAAYRIAIQGWPKGEAILEMTRGGFGFHGQFENLVEYLEKMDVEAVRKMAGIQTPPVAGMPDGTMPH